MSKCQNCKSFIRGQTKKRLAIFTALVFFALMFHLTGYTSSGAKNVTKFFVVLTDILSEFTFTISRNINDTRVLVWTRKAPLKYYQIETGDVEGLKRSNFNTSVPTKILIHGFSDNGLTQWVKAFKKNYLNAGDFNVVSIDWAPLAESPWYTTAAKNAMLVGKLTADFILFLVSEGVLFESIHILGSSLGAQVAGYAGFFTGGRIGRITGLDPSGPLFHSVPSSDHLDKEDAKFVDVIHTAGKWVGNDEVIGHADFFVNTGRAPQPGCEGRESLDLTCSHFKAWKIFFETIENGSPQIYALKCSNYNDFKSGSCCNCDSPEVALMGEATPNTTRGIFFLYTNRDSPHAKIKNESIACNKNFP